MTDRTGLDGPNLTEWNDTVRWFMRLWDVAEVIGVTPCLEQHLDELPHGGMAATLAQKGNCRETYLRLFLLSLRALLVVEPHGVAQSDARGMEDEMFRILEQTLVHDVSRYFRQLPDGDMLENLAIVSDRR